jgi:hypothetical protein
MIAEPTATHTHVTWNGRRYGHPGSNGYSARHAAVPAGGYGSYRTLCGRLWHVSEEEVGGGVAVVGPDCRVTCKRCRAKSGGGR